MDAHPDPRLVSIYQRALICRTFPGYRLHELRDTPAVELLTAMKLLEIAAQAAS